MAISHSAFEKRSLPYGAIIIAQQSALLPLYFFIPTWIVFLNILSAGLVYFASNKNQFQIPRWLKVLITVAAIAGVFIVFRKISGRDAGVALIAAMYGLKILETNKVRDAYLVLNLGFFIIVAGFLFSQKPQIALYQFLPVLAILNALTQLHYSEKNSPKSFRTVIAGLSKYLILAIPIMLILFFFFPRLGGPLWRMPGGASAVSGVSDSMSPGDVSSLQLFDKIAFRAKFENENPNPISLYWRVLVLDEFDGLTWTRRGAAPHEVKESDLEGMRVLDYSVTMEPSRQNYLVTLDRAVKSPANSRLLSDFVVYSQYRILDRMRYSMQSAPSLSIEQAMLTPQRRITFTRVPNTGNARAKAWAKSQRSSFADDKSYIQSLLERINQSPYFYTLTPPILAEDTVDSFWFDFKRGFCEHYASAFVYLARAAGVPARVVIGYQGGDRNPLSDYWIVRYANAHAWTEVWYEGEGWVRVDPTAAIARHRIEESLLSDYQQREGIFDDFSAIDLESIGVFKQFEYWMDEVNNDWNEWIIDFNSSKQRQLFEGWGLKGLDNSQLIGFMIFGVAIFTLGISAQFLHAKRKVARLQLAYNKLVLSLERKLGHAIDPQIGPSELLELLNQNSIDDFKLQKQCLMEYIQLRYRTEKQSEADEKLLAKRMRIAAG